MENSEPVETVFAAKITPEKVSDNDCDCWIGPQLSRQVEIRT